MNVEPEMGGKTSDEVTDIVIIMFEREHENHQDSKRKNKTEDE